MAFIQYNNFARIFFRFITIHAFDRETDGQTMEIWRLIPPCIAYSSVKMARDRMQVSIFTNRKSHIGF